MARGQDPSEFCTGVGGAAGKIKVWVASGSGSAAVAVAVAVAVALVVAVTVAAAAVASGTGVGTKISVERAGVVVASSLDALMAQRSTQP
mmetsp:Transcript_49989/g.99282  ORF Transcript_49989/g.99282 Transcript_49989/m.99282 type:complete len:90 (-) Transcript_49989:7-276(-)